jgi:ketosteroid isomerase-like protein
MSQQNVELARRLWEDIVEGARTRRAEAGISDLGWDPDIEYVEDPQWPGTGTYRGREAIQARFAEYLEILGPIDIRVQEITDAGAEVVSIFRVRGKSVGSGLPFEHDWAYVWTFRDGRVIRWRAYFDKDQALEAAGLAD